MLSACSDPTKKKENTMLYRADPDFPTFVRAVIDAGSSGVIAPCLAPHADATGASEKWPSDGGFLVPEQVLANWSEDASDTGLIAFSGLPLSYSERIACISAVGPSRVPRTSHNGRS
jgi:hypothetical protein